MRHQKEWNASQAFILLDKKEPITEIARKLGVTRATIYSFMKQHKIKPYRPVKRGAVPDSEIIAHLADLDSYAKQEGYAGAFQLLNAAHLPPVWASAIFKYADYPLHFVRQLWTKGLKCTPYKNKVNLFHPKTGKVQDIAPLLSKYGDAALFWSDPMAWINLHVDELIGRWSLKQYKKQKQLDI